MKFLAALYVSLLGASLVQGQQVTYSNFTLEQVIEQLGIKGGNWKIQAKEEVYFAFVVTQKDKGGKETKDYYWSVKPAKEFAAFFKYQSEKVPNAPNLMTYEFALGLDRSFAQWTGGVLRMIFRGKWINR